MNRLKTNLAVTLLVLWVPATSLCLMESAGWLSKNDNCCDPQSSEMAPCCALASATYKMDDGGSASAPARAEFFAGFIDFGNLKSLSERVALLTEYGVSPPELSTSWQFSFRAALAPRAPSLAS